MTLAAPEFEFKRVIIEKKSFLSDCLCLCVSHLEVGVVGSWDRDRQTGTRQRQTDIRSERRLRGRDREIDGRLRKWHYTVISLFTSPTFISGDL